MRTPRSTIIAPEPAQTPLVAARRAADAIEELCSTAHDCALEVRARGGCHEARSRLPIAKGAAVERLLVLADMLTGKDREEVTGYAEGCRDGFARTAWGLRVVALVSEAMAPPDAYSATRGPVTPREAASGREQAAIIEGLEANG